MTVDELIRWHEDRARDYTLDYATIAAHRETVVALRNAGSSRPDTTALRRLASAALWTGRWYDAGCNTVNCTYADAQTSDEVGEIAHPCPLGLTDYLVAVQPSAILSLLDSIDGRATP